MQTVTEHMRGLFNKSVVATSHFLFPPLCPSCGIVIGTHPALCSACWADIAFIERPFCPVTGMPFDHDLGDGIVSAEALAAPPIYDRARSAVIHQGIALNIVHGHKFRDRSDVTPLMVTWMQRIGGELLQDADIIIPVPLHYWRYLTRRYNQSAEIARLLAKREDLAYQPNILIRQKNTQSQRGLSRKERQTNVANAFAINERQTPQIAQKKILLVDDVLTTGATVNAAAKVLKAHGAARVDVLTFSRVPA